MKIKESIELAILSAAELVKQGRTNEVLLASSKSGLNRCGELFDFWCDGCGNDCSCEEMCSDAAMLECIDRYLERTSPET